MPQRTLHRVLVFGMTIVVLLSFGCRQPDSLQERVRLLRTEIAAPPTTADNFQTRLETMEEWWDDLSVRGRLRIPTIVVLEFEKLRMDRGFTEEAPALMEHAVAVLSFAEDHGDEVGSLVRVDSNELVANEFTTVVLEYTVGEVGIGMGGMLRAGQRYSANTLQRLQNTDPSADAFVSFEVTSEAKTEESGVSWQGLFNSLFSSEPAPALRVVEGSLKEGDKVRITLGDRSGGSRGLRMPPRDADDFRFALQMDPTGSGSFVLADFVSTRIRGSEPKNLRAIVPSVVATGESFRLRIAVEDRYFSPASYPGGEFTVRLEDRVVGSIPIPAGRSEGELANIRLDQQGGHRFEVASSDGELKTLSNPVLVEADPQQRVFWGELHGHSGLEDGTGTVARYYEYARDVAFLDFGSLTGHDVTLTPPGWDEIRRETEAANRSGSFVAFMAYEWTVEWSSAGHHNVFFRNDPGRYATYREAIDKGPFYEKLREIDQADNILVIPHAHNPGNWNVSDGEIERLVEIYSMHGSFEFFGQRFLDRGYRVGLIAASDDHTGHPGNAPASVSVRGGLAAVYAGGLDRDSIWGGLRNRATYATSGKRPVVKVSVDGRPVGQSLPLGTIPTFSLRVLGTAAIDHIDVIGNGKVRYSQEYLSPDESKPEALQIMFHSPTDPPGEERNRPLAAVNWRGWISVDRGKIRSMEPLGSDIFTDQFHREGDSKIWFSCKTRGDLDGVLLTLDRASADTEVTVAITEERPRDQPMGRSPGLRLPIEPPSQTPIEQIRFTLAEVGRRAKFNLTPERTVFARLAKAKGDWDVSFDYRPHEAPEQNDYFYLRIVQVDGETIWTSPVWFER